ncbi:MAG: HAMP domain-containing histidine kinase [Actinomycetota bacterium]|nr:HAMP domain-containing histidine kinase [Actinomycetota bacterium]
MTGLGARTPLRTQVLLLLLATVAPVVAVTALAGTAALRSYLLDRVDDTLAQSVRDARGPVFDDDGPGRRGPRHDRSGDHPPSPRSFVRALYDADGALVGVDEGGLSVEAADAPALPRALPERPFTVPARNGDGRWRAVAQPLADGRTLLVALPLDDVDDTVRQLLVIHGVVGVVVLLAAGLLGWAGVRRSLRPLGTVEATAEAIAAGDLSVRVPPGDPRTEVGSLAASFNSMVDRFESAYRAQQASETAARASEDRMRRFVGDASHELRTPLTSIRGFAELFRSGAVGEADLARVMRRIEDEASRMGLLVEDLLLLARLDQQRPLVREPVDLLTVAADVVHDAAAVATGHTVRLLPPGSGDPLVVLGDDARLRQVLANLVANATTHTAAGTTVDVALRRQDGGPVGGSGAAGEVVVEVRDDGPGMSPDVAGRAFERFYRADASRTRAGSPTTGSGLGLSIVAALVAAHGGRVAVDSELGRGTVFTVALPAR